jgi:hypothetical protein
VNYDDFTTCCRRLNIRGTNVRENQCYILNSAMKSWLIKAGETGVWVKDRRFV